MPDPGHGHQGFLVEESLSLKTEVAAVATLTDLQVPCPNWT